jgi:hypothetical protein
MARTRQPVTGKFKPRKDRQLRPDEHHIGWDRAFQEALDNIGWPRGTHQAQVEFTAIVDVKNPGSVIEYHVTLI